MISVFESQEIIQRDMFLKHLSFNGYSRPVMLICETVNICNNRCIICAYPHMSRPKTVMPMETFRKVIENYSAMGGGYLSLTPVVGDVFMDKHLIERLEIIRQYKNITSLSVTTNAAMAERLSDEDLKFALRHFNKMLISIYGLDIEEYLAMTNRDSYSLMVESIKRILKLIDVREKVHLGFRFLKMHTDEQVEKWIKRTFEATLRFTMMTTDYANWGGLDMSTSLPFSAQWKKCEQNKTQCIMPLVAFQVLSNGKVSFCPCNDFDADDDLSLGELGGNASLLQMYNSERARDLWNFEKNMPRFCRKCSFHIPLSRLSEFAYIFEDPLTFIGG